MENVRRNYVTFVFSSEGCEDSGKRVDEYDETLTTGRCSFLSTFWQRTRLMWYGRCLNSLCVSTLDKDEVVEPNVWSSSSI